MDSSRLDLGLVAGLTVESFGEPGHRTFRVLAETPEGSVSLWVEKEQVVMLGEAVDQLLERVPAPGAAEPRAVETATFVGELEVRVGELSLSYDGSRDGFALEATEFVSPLPLEHIALVADRQQLERIRDQVEEIVTASHPRCVLCGTPLAGVPHFCPQSNGHAKFHEESGS